MTWECLVCNSKNPDDAEICLECGSLKEEPTYDIEDDLDLEEDP